jgi:hypothetical protein
VTSHYGTTFLEGDLISQEGKCCIFNDSHVIAEMRSCSGLRDCLLKGRGSQVGPQRMKIKSNIRAGKWGPSVPPVGHGAHREGEVPSVCQKMSTSYGTRRSLTAFTRGRCWLYAQPQKLSSHPQTPVLRFILILSSIDVRVQSFQTTRTTRPPPPSPH